MSFCRNSRRPVWKVKLLRKMAFFARWLPRLQWYVSKMTLPSISVSVLPFAAAAPSPPHQARMLFRSTQFLPRTGL